MIRRLTYFLFLFLLVGCHKKENKHEMENAAEVKTETEVETMTLHRSSFPMQLICNGKLAAVSKSEISFQGQGVVTKIYVHDGSRVVRGTLLASIDKSDKQLQVKKCERSLESARITLADKLISLGYNGLNDKIPEDVLQRAKLTSGYFSAQIQLAEARRALTDCDLRAPFAGRVADMECQPFQVASKFGKLIDDTFFDVEFKVLEAELSTIKIGETVKVTPFVDNKKVFVGKVVQINPVVDEKGLVKIRARMRNTDNMLIDGMNVKVIVERTIPRMIVVPKSAVAERDGYHVIFEVEDNEAVWTYVDILYSNSTQYAITGCREKETAVHEGEKVIISDIQNLADGTAVKLKKH